MFGRNQAPTFEPCDRRLCCGPGKAGFFRECSVADGNRATDSLLLGGQPKVNSKRGGLVIVTDEITHEGVDDVVIEGNGHEGIPINNTAKRGTLLFWLAFHRLTGKETCA